ncbi:glutathione S-transferase [Litoribrevibacter albus]|uniref:Glutathione S-transferase n=2 Tax=Litoribrevibacter albus TaxID=1473156 RepID=A0AA37W8N8_9GAMM|nr:glutathione S-transferase [Litoribrevibacter albus]
MRARLALWQSGIGFQLREILLKDKPQSMLDASPKGTVPVLIVNTESKFGSDHPRMIVDESLDIMLWALTQQDPKGWLPRSSDLEDALALIERMDTEFKSWLDRYKYFDRYPERSQIEYRQEFEVFLSELEQRLNQSSCLSGSHFLSCNHFGFLDAAIAPFIRQFAHVDLEWFEHSPYPKLIQWLNEFKSSELFQRIMKKFPVWKEDDGAVLIQTGEVVSQTGS